MPSNRSDHTTKTTSTTLSKRTPLTAIRDNLTKKFSLKKKQENPKPPQQQQPLRARRYANPSLSKDQQYRFAVGWSNVFYECEDRLCNKYFLNDANGDKQSKKPKSATIIELPQDMIEKRTEYLQTSRGPPIDRSCETIQLLILAENESIQRVRLEAAGLGGKQLESEDIHSVQDVLHVLNMSHHQQAFLREGIDLSTAFFLKDEDLEELGLKTGERIRLQIVLDFMRQVKVQVTVAANTQVMRTTRFIKGDIVEHLKESENLIRKGKVVGVHADDLASGVYYTVALENENGYELQSAERKLEFPGVWETTLRAQGIEPIFKEPGFEEEEKVPVPPASAAAPTNNNNALEKYTRMKRAGLPDGAIMDAMRRDGVEAPPGFFAETAPSMEREEFSFIVEEEEIAIVEEEDIDQQRARRKSSVTSGILAPPPPLPHQEKEPYRANAVSLSELEILKAIDEQLALEEASQNISSSSPLDNSNFAKLRRMSSSTTTGLPPPPPVPQYSADYFDGMRIASLEPTIEEEDFEFSGMTSPPPPIPGGGEDGIKNYSMELSGMSAPPPPPPQQQQEAKWEEDISFLHQHHSFDMDAMHEEPFEFEDIDYTIT